MKHADGKTLHQLFRTLYGAGLALENVEELVHRASGLTGVQSKNIGHLLSGGPMTISDLAYDRGVSRQSVQVAVGTMIELGYVCFLDNPRHKKAKLIQVTDLGRESFNAAQNAEFSLIERAFPDMKTDEVEVAIRVLKTMKKKLLELREEMEPK